jgi:GxxExxY protein
MKYNENDYNALTEIVIQCAIEVHKELGPGLLESVYEICLIKLLKDEGVKAKTQVRVPIVFKNESLDKEFIIDVLVQDVLVIEIKAVEKILPVHEAQLLTYLKLSGKKLGLLLNFNADLLKNGIRRKINGNLND